MIRLCSGVGIVAVVADDPGVADTVVAATATAAVAIASFSTLSSAAFGIGPWAASQRSSTSSTSLTWVPHAGNPVPLDVLSFVTNVAVGIGVVITF